MENTLKHYRTKAGLTQGQLAEKASISPALVSKLESGERQIGKIAGETLLLIADALKVNPALLLGGAVDEGTELESVDTGGLVMIGLPEASEETACFNNSGVSDRSFVQIDYDMDDGKILPTYHIGGNWTKYRSESIIYCGSIRHHASQQYIADMIIRAVDIRQDGERLLAEESEE